VRGTLAALYGISNDGDERNERRHIFTQTYKVIGKDLKDEEI
jgi:hypothetical protein